MQIICKLCSWILMDWYIRCIFHSAKTEQSSLGRLLGKQPDNREYGCHLNFKTHPKGPWKFVLFTYKLVNFAWKLRILWLLINTVWRGNINDKFMATRLAWELWHIFCYLYQIIAEYTAISQQNLEFDWWRFLSPFSMTSLAGSSATLWMKKM